MITLIYRPERKHRLNNYDKQFCFVDNTEILSQRGSTVRSKMCVIDALLPNNCNHITFFALQNGRAVQHTDNVLHLIF